MESIWWLRACLFEVHGNMFLVIGFLFFVSIPVGLDGCSLSATWALHLMNMIPFSVFLPFFLSLYLAYWLGPLRLYVVWSEGLGTMCIYWPTSVQPFIKYLDTVHSLCGMILDLCCT